MPAPSWGVIAPCRRAIRRITRSEYSSSSFVPAITWRTMDVAAITSAASRASPEGPDDDGLLESVGGQLQRERVDEQHRQEAHHQRPRKPQRRYHTAAGSR